MIEVVNLDSTHAVESKYIDSIAMSYDLLEFVKGCRLYEINEIINTDYRSYIIDLNIEKYFEIEIGSLDKINYRIIDPKKRTHREKFNEYAEELLNNIVIETRLDYAHTHQELEEVDKDITYILNKIRKKINRQK